MWTETVANSTNPKHNQFSNVIAINIISWPYRIVAHRNVHESLSFCNFVAVEVDKKFWQVFYWLGAFSLS